MDEQLVETWLTHDRINHTAFVGYLVSHVSHHPGPAGWTLKAAGRPLDKNTAFGLSEWGLR